MPSKKNNRDLKKYAAAFARKGGLARARKMSPEERSKSARRAVQARWAKVRAKKGGSK